MSAPAIKIPRHLVNQILHLAQLSPDREASALIGGRDHIPRSCYPVLTVTTGNLRPDPVSCSDALNAMQARGESLFAVLHTHPYSPAVPNLNDQLLQEFPDTPRLIVSLNTKGVLEMRGYKLDSTNQAIEIDLELSE